ncbi:MAG: NAD(P)/FAD-dependent oxidoreductase [Pirellulales bacterium]|jgi:geranylgeranyl reductase family protein
MRELSEIDVMLDTASVGSDLGAAASASPAASPEIPSRVDVVVIGGGPSGATVATLLAMAGRRVALFERDRFPRFHVGESLIPECYWTLGRLDMLGKMRASGFTEKHSVQFVNERGTLSAPFYFADHKEHESSRTWQVTRREFDDMMLRNAEEKGAIVFEGTRVLEVTFEGQRATGVIVQQEGRAQQMVSAEVVVDASGQSSMIAARLGTRQWDQELKKAAVWSYWKGAERGVGKDEGATTVMQLDEKQGWFWYIPLADDMVSVGVVADNDYLLKDRRTKDPDAIYQEEIARCPGLGSRLEQAERVAPVRVAKEYSYRASEVAGDGWVLVGDAFGFLDPLYSSGILLALRSGEVAADAIDAALLAGDTSGQRLGTWGPDFVRGMDRMRRLVMEFYDGLNFGKLVKRHPNLQGVVTDLLIGDLFNDRVDAIVGPLDELRAEMFASTN